MQRKVVKHGSSTLTISLPADWVKIMQIKSGDELNVQKSNRVLIISADKELIMPKYEFIVKNINYRLLEAKLYSLYKLGYNEISIRFNNPETLPLIQRILNEGLLGYEIIDQTPDYVLIKNVLTEMSENIDILIRRVFLITLSLAKNTIEYIEKGNIKKIKELISLQYTINQLVSFLHRQLTIKGYKEYNKTIFLYILLWLTERVGDGWVDFCSYLARKENSDLILSKEMVDFLKKVLELFSTFYQNFYKYDEASLLWLTDAKEHLIKDLHNTSFKFKTKEMPLVFILYLIVCRIDDYYGSYFGFSN